MKNLLCVELNFYFAYIEKGGFMSISFSQFCKNNKQNKTEEESLKEKYDELKDLGYDELTEKLYEQVKEQKQNGTFNYSALCDGVERMKGFIPYETYQNMKNMLEKLK